MPAMSRSRPELYGESLVWDILQNLDDGDLYFWHSYTPPQGTEIDLLLADLNSGVYCIEIKGITIEGLRYLDLQSMECYEGKIVDSPFRQSLRATRTLAGLLKTSSGDVPWLSPIAAFPRITRKNWGLMFPTGVLSDPPCLLLEDFESLESLRARLTFLAMNPPMGLGRREKSPQVTLEQVCLLYQSITGQTAEAFHKVRNTWIKRDSVEQVDAGPVTSRPDQVAPRPKAQLSKFSVDEILGRERVQSSENIQTLLNRTISLIEKEGSVYGSPGLEALVRWLDALSESSSRLRVSVIGEFKAGKSSLINALLKRKVCFVDEFEATGIRAVYTDGSVETVVLTTDSGASENTSLEEFLLRCEKRDTRGLKSALITIRSGFPFDLADSPGLGTQTEGHHSQAEEELRRTDLLLLTIDSNDAGSAQESTLITRASEIGLPLIVLLTKADLLGEDEEAQLREYISNETGIDDTQIIAVSAHRYEQGYDKGMSSLVERLVADSGAHESLWQAAQDGKRREVTTAMIICLRRLLDLNEPNSKFVKTELVYLEKSAADFSRIAKQAWLDSLKNEVSAFLDKPELQEVTTSSDLQVLVENEMPSVFKRATARFMGALNSLILSEWQKDLQIQAANYQRRLDEVLAHHPGSVDLAFLEAERDAFSRRAQLIVDEQEDDSQSKKLLAIGLGAAAAFLTASFAPLAIGAIAAVFIGNTPSSSTDEVPSIDSRVKSKIESHLVNSFNEIGPHVDRAIEQLIEDIASRSLVRIVRDTGRPDISLIGKIERQAHDLLNELIECSR